MSSGREDKQIPTQDNQGQDVARDAAVAIQNDSAHFEERHEPTPESSVAHHGLVEHGECSIEERLQFLSGRFDLLAHLVEMQGKNHEALEKQFQSFKKEFETSKAKMEGILAADKARMAEVLAEINHQGQRMVVIAQSMERACAFLDKYIEGKNHQQPN